MTITDGHAGGGTAGGTVAPLGMIWVELGLECQLSCLHCYAGAGPGGGWGSMAAGDWERVIRQAADLGAGHVTFIGGEPTLSRALGGLVRLAVGLGLGAEVYSNLVHVSPALWEVFSGPGVSLAVSWYSGDRAQHAVITGGRDTWRQTRANVAEAVRRGIPVRAGLIDGIVPGQLADEGERELRALGVGDVGRDVVREFGRGTLAAPDQACGRCGVGRLAVLSDGTVTPCPMTRWLAAANVRDTGLGAIMAAVPGVAAVLPVRGGDPCDPDNPCDPDCRPGLGCYPLCTPAACKPIL
jgi:MoaA/NifB/PqqE/SkfB family radical SAM enzyme